MCTHPLPRRQWLRVVAATASSALAWPAAVTASAALTRAAPWTASAALATSTLALSACARPQPASLALPTLVVDASDFIPLTAELTRAWNPRKSGAFVQFGVRPGAGPSAIPDLVQILPDYSRGQPVSIDNVTLLPLRRCLADANFDLGTLVPGVTEPWTDPDGDVLALPIQIAELQFYVNHDRLKALGFQEPKDGTWTFADMRIALGLAVTADPNGEAPLVSGAWDSPNFIGAAMLGFGGAIHDPDGRLDVTLSTNALRQFVDFARQVRWPPAGLSQTTARTYQDFTVHGFAGLAASALFAFVQLWSFLVNAATKIALRAMAPAPFPAFPARRVIPGLGAMGLAVNKASPHADLAVRFLLWLLEPDQQRLLAACHPGPGHGRLLAARDGREPRPAAV